MKIARAVFLQDKALPDLQTQAVDWKITNAVANCGAVQFTGLTASILSLHNSSQTNTVLYIVRYKTSWNYS